MIYVVQEGDTIYSIAQRYGVSVQRITMDNGLGAQSTLVRGQALILLMPEVLHTVRPGESVQSVAAQYGMSRMQLLQKNPNLIATPTLFAGQQLAIRFEGEQDWPAYLNGYAYPDVNRNLLRRQLPFLTDFIIFGYGFTETGRLIPVEDHELIALSYQYGAAPILLLASLTEDGTFSGERASLLFHDLELQNTVIGNLLAVMQNRGYLGIDIDFEYIRPEDGPAYLSFLENITARMHESGYRVNVDLAPKISSEQKGLLYEAHDYAAIGAIADTVLLMTYEWGYTYGPPMAVAPLPSVRRVVEYAVTQIPPEKIMMGIPNYGYDWTLPFERGITRATSIGNEYAVQVAERNGVPIEFDEAAQSPFFEYWGADGNLHIVWFEDVRSIEGKFNLTREFGLRGAAYWNLMRPFSQNWALISQEFDIAKLLA